MKRTVMVLIVAGALIVAFALPLAQASPQNVQKNRPLPSSNLKPPLPAVLLPELQINKIYFANYVDPNSGQPITMIRGNLKLGQRVCLICELKNAGRDAKGPWSLGFYIDNAMVWANSVGDLAGGSDLIGIGVWTPNQEGVHNYRCVLDVQKQVAESNESNNQLEIMFQVVK